MMNSNYPLVLDLHTAVSQASIPVPRGDTARSLSITLCEDGKAFELPIGVYAVFTGEKADGTTLVNHCIIERGVIKYYFTEQTTSAIGRIAAQIKVYDADGRLITSPRITIIVHETAVTDAMISENEATVLEGIIASEAKRVEAEALREEAEAARVKAENEREEAFANAKFSFEEERAEIVADMENAKADIISSAANTVDTKTSESLGEIENATSRYVSSAKTEIFDAKENEVNDAKEEIQSEKVIAIGDLTASKNAAVGDIQGLRAYVDEKEDLLWTNNDVTSAFLARDVALSNYNRYRAFRFVFVTGPRNAWGYKNAKTFLPDVILELGQYGEAFMPYGNDYTPRRQIYLDTNGVAHFGQVSSSPGDDCVIPVRIYGILNNEMGIDYVEGIKQEASEALKTANEAKEIALSVKPTDNILMKKFSNALVGEASGEAVRCDVSPIEHELDVKVEPPNLIPYPYTTTDTTIGDVSFTYNGRTVVVNGDELGTINSTFVFGNAELEAGEYTIGGFSLNVDSDSDFIMLYVKDSVTENIIFAEPIGNITDYKGMLVLPQKTNVKISVEFSMYTPNGTMTPYLVKEDMSGVKLLRYGKNLLQYDPTDIGSRPNVTILSQLENGVICKGIAGGSPGLPLHSNGWYFVGYSGVKVPRGVPCAISADFTFIEDPYRPSDVSAAKNRAVITVDKVGEGTITNISNPTFRPEVGVTVRMYAVFSSSCDVKFGFPTCSGTVKIENILLEVGTSVTEYEPYTEPTEHTANADGTVDGVMSVYPVTTLMTDTDGVTIDATYNKDANKVVAYLEERIAALELAIVSQ